MSHETETGMWPEATVSSCHGSSTSAHIDQSVNKTMPWIALLAILSTAALVIASMGLAFTRAEIAQMRADYAFQIDQLSKKVQVAEMEARVAQDDVTNYVKRERKYKER